MLNYTYVNITQAGFESWYIYTKSSWRGDYGESSLSKQ